MSERVVRTLQDLEEAMTLAVREGGCRIRVGDQVAALVAADELNDYEAEGFLAHPVVAERLTRAARSLDEGRGVSHQEVVRRFGKRKI
ncbi:MAG: hypothetical protein ACYC5Y_10350 [Symbiobacteriia bacterium]